MMRRLPFLPLLVAGPLLSACDLAPHYARPASAVPSQWPQGASYDTPGNAEAAGMPWRSLIGNSKLQSVIGQALVNNRDLRAAVANLASARAQYHIQRSEQLPIIAAGAGATIERGITSSTLDANSYSTSIGMSSFEIDLFGRLKNLTREAFEAYLATQSGARSTRLAIVAETATAYVTLAADRDLLKVARKTEASGQRSLELTQSLFHSGLTNASDVQNAITVVEQARSDVENFTTAAAQDRNALELLVGAPVDDALLPTSLSEVDDRIAAVPAGLSSTVLLQRPDVLEAEHSLKSASAGIGAARAAFFPTITLTSAVGVASTALSSLFTGGALSWSAAPSASLPVVGGPIKGNLQFAKAQRDYYLARYEKAVQQAFKDVADGLARRATITRQRQAQQRLVAAAAKAYTLADAQYRAGTDSFLNALTAQRTLYASRQTEIGAILTDISNRITLYQAIGADQSL
jgi:multidrug efflux system outer membrane protein